jgi:hypothetical protein
VVRDVGRDRAFAGSLLNVLMAELEVAGWSRESLNGLIRTADEFEMAVPHLRRLGDRLGAR